MFYGNKNITPSFLRARITAIRKLIEELPTNRDEKNPDRTLVRNGIIPETQQKRFNEILDYEHKLTFALNEPLSFTELTSFNTWFVLHPEKVCGEEVITTSREFPVTIKGTKLEVIQTINSGMEQIAEMQVKNNDSENESDHPSNRFGNAEKALDWTVSEFNAYYHDEVFNFFLSQKPIEEQIEKLQRELKEPGLNRAKRKEISAKINETIQQRNQNKNQFESEWIDFCMGLRNIIIEKAGEKGLQIEDDSNIPDDILLAITDRPGIEQYWKTIISEVIEKELQYFIQEKENQSNSINILELEALALETELELLTI